MQWNMVLQYTNIGEGKKQVSWKLEADQLSVSSIEVYRTVAGLRSNQPQVYVKVKDIFDGMLQSVKCAVGYL